jgi:hypothetical protein
VETHNDSLESSTPPRPRLRWLKRLGGAVLIAALVVVAVLAWQRGEKASKLQQMLADMDRREPGWRLDDLEAAREPIPDEENSARVVVAAARLLPRDWPPKGFDERFVRLAPEEQLTADQFALLRAELFRIRPAVDEAAKLAALPQGRHTLHYERNPIATLLPDQSKCRDIFNLLGYEALRQNQIGDSKNALRTCRAALNAARSLGDEPIYISQLIRIAGVIKACQAIERTLAQGEPPAEEMAGLQKLLENEDAFPGLLVATRGERASLHQVFEAVKQGVVTVDQLADSHSNWAEKSFVSLWRMDTSQDQALSLSLMARRIQEVQQPLHEQAALEKQFEQDMREVPKNAVLTRYMMPAMAKIGEAFRRKQAIVRCTIVALAAERYRREKKTWPDTLAQLCPSYLAAVPVDPYDGAPLRYRRVADGIVVYSAGVDALDNGGTFDREALMRSGTDLGCRLWDANKRRQQPKPKPSDAMQPR